MYMYTICYVIKRDENDRQTKMSLHIIRLRVCTSFRRQFNVFSKQFETNIIRFTFKKKQQKKIKVLQTKQLT